MSSKMKRNAGIREKAEGNVLPYFIFTPLMSGIGLSLVKCVLCELVDKIKGELDCLGQSLLMKLWAVVFSRTMFWHLPNLHCSVLLYCRIQKDPDSTKAPVTWTTSHKPIFTRKILHFKFHQYMCAFVSGCKNGKNSPFIKSL